MSSNENSIRRAASRTVSVSAVIRALSLDSRRRLKPGRLERVAFATECGQLRVQLAQELVVAGSGRHVLVQLRLAGLELCERPFQALELLARRAQQRLRRRLG